MKLQRLGILLFLQAFCGSLVSLHAQTDSAISQAIAAGYWDAEEGKERGTIFTLGTVSVRNPQDSLLDGYSIEPWIGAIANQKNLISIQDAMQTYLLNHGFPFATFTSDAKVDSLGRPLVYLTLTLISGDAFKLGGIRTLETRTRPDVVRRLGLWKVGEPYSQDRLEQGLTRLRRTGYFESVDRSGLFRDSTRNLLYPSFRLPDARANRVGGVLGYDSKAPKENRLGGYLDVHLINLFGTARDFDFGFESRTQTEREARLAYVEPWLLHLSLGLRLELNYLQQDSSFWEWNRNAVFFQDLGFKSRVEMGLGLQDNYEAAVPSVSSRRQSEAIQSSIRLIIDNRDRVPLTFSGYRTEIGFTGWRREEGDSSYFVVQSQWSGETWLPFSQKGGLKLTLRSATNLPLKGRFNRGELYTVGGSRSLRGYREREFLTNAYALGDAEFYTWLNRRSRLFAFISPGLVNRLEGDYYWRQVLGYGAGIELAKGDWSLAVSYALNPERSFGDGFLHMRVDNRF